MHRSQLIAAYLDYLNNFVTVMSFANHYGYTYNEANQLIALARQVYQTPHPEA